MPYRPFDRLVPAPDAVHAKWIVEAMNGREGVALIVPDGFDAYVRILHPLGEQTWEAVGPAYVQVSAEPYPYPFPEVITGVAGDMGMALVDTLIPALAAATSTPQTCHRALVRLG